MAILGFPSSAIIGNLDWTGYSSSLVASSSFQVTTTGPQTNSVFTADTFGFTLSTDNSSNYITVGTDYAGIAIVSNDNLSLNGSAVNIASTSSGVFVNPTAGQNFQVTTGGGSAKTQFNGRVNVDGSLTNYGTQVATQPFAIAAAVALG
jgi:hypothetical protein